MKRFVVLVLVLFCGLIAGARAQGLDDEYVHIFKLIQEGDALNSSAPSQALAKYLDAQAALDRLHKGSPEWNTRIVNYRLNYLATRISALSTTAPPSPAAQSTESKPPSPAPAAQPGQGLALSDSQAQLAGAREQVRQLQSDKVLLEAKLKEALAMRPAEADPVELTKAGEKIKALQKENDLMRVSIEREKQSPTPPVNVHALEQAQQSLAESNRRLGEETARVSKLTLEKEALESRLKNSSTDTAAVSGLRTENQALKQKVAELQAAPHPSVNPPEPAPQSPQAQAQIAMLQADKETLRLEKVALENRVKQLSGSAAGNGASAAAVPSGESARIKQLEGERDELQKRLDVATKEMYGRKGKGTAGRTQDLENQLALVRARLEIFEARAVPYTAEELALLKRPQAKLADADPKAGKKSIKELPAGSAALVAEAQRYFAAKQFDKAEAAYTQVLQQDPKNVPTLANLAAIEVEAEHFDKAEANVKQALAVDPEDAYCLYVLGILRFRQGKYDEALDALSHSAKIDPQNPEVQNYLGLALSEKGMRVPAEAALRRAIQLQPGYAGAHYNLAVVYATQQPPATELARSHYQKAVAAGHPRNPELEKRWEGRQ